MILQEETNTTTVISQAFNEAADRIVKDPLMQCFQENKESRLFMFERMKEIFMECTTFAREILEQQHQIQGQTKQESVEVYKNEIRSLANNNRLLKEKLGQYIQGKASSPSRLDGSPSQNKLCQQISNLKSHLGSQQDMLSETESVNQQLNKVIKGLNSKINKLEGELQAVRNTQMLSIKVNDTQQIGISNQDDIQQQQQYKNDQQLQQEKYTSNQSNKTIKELENKLKKANFQIQEMNDEFSRKMDSEINSSNLKDKKIEELTTLLSKQDKGEGLNARIRQLQNNSIQSKKQLSKLKLQVEEAEFLKEQMQESVINLKVEINEISTKLTEERKKKHDLDISLITLKDQYNELNVQFQSQACDNDTLTSQVFYGYNVFRTIFCRKGWKNWKKKQKVRRGSQSLWIGSQRSVGLLSRTVRMSSKSSNSIFRTSLPSLARIIPKKMTEFRS